MKITRRGTIPSQKIWVGVCRKCNSEAEAFQYEMNHITHDDRNGDSFSWETCPVCGAGDHEDSYGGMLFHPKRD